MCPKGRYYASAKEAFTINCENWKEEKKETNNPPTQTSNKTCSPLFFPSVEWYMTSYNVWQFPHLYFEGKECVLFCSNALEPKSTFSSGCKPRAIETQCISSVFTLRAECGLWESSCHLMENFEKYLIWKHVFFCVTYFPVFLFPHSFLLKTVH